MVRHRSAAGNVLELPVTQLQEITRTYLRRTRNPTGEKLELHLRELIKQQQEKDVAIAACARELSVQVVRDLLRKELQSRLSEGLKIERYMWAIIAVNRANPNAVVDIEAECAFAVFQLSIPNVLTVGRHLKTYASFLGAGAPQDVVLCPVVHDIPLRACRSFASQLVSLKAESKWRLARDASLWLSELQRQPLPALEQLLNIVFRREWQAWSAWRPNPSRLNIWEQFTDEQRHELKDILALEGPDISTGKPTLREGLIPKAHPRHLYTVGHGRFLAKLSNNTQTEAKNRLNEVLDTLDKACQETPSALNLFVGICLHNCVDDAMLIILKNVIAARDPTVSNGVFALLSATENSLQMNSMKKLLPALDREECQGLRGALAPQIVQIIEEAMLRLQDKLCQYLKDGQKADGVAMKLHSLGLSLQGASWIYPMLTEGLRSVLPRWPTTEYIDALFKLRADAHGITLESTSALVDGIDEYYTWCLIGRGNIGDDMRGQVEGLVDLWQQTKDVDLRAAALAIAERSNIPIAIRRQCLGQLCNMREDFVREVVMVVRKETDRSCVNFINILTSRTITDSARSCWRELLMWMIENRKLTLLDHTLSQFNVESWLGLIETVRKLFGDSLYSSADAPPILMPSLHAWTTRLSETYFGVLTTLEERIGSGSTMKWILTGWEESDTILPVLNILKEPNQDQNSPLVQSILAGFNLDGSNATEVFTALGLITRTSQSSMDACIRVLELQRKSGTELAEGLLAAWLQASDVSAMDKRALRAVAPILGLRARTSVTAREVQLKLQATSDYLNGQYSAIIEEAQRLDNIRRALKNSDARKTSDFLSRIGIEDPSVLEDATAFTPASLVDVVEKIGDGEFEMAFPLTHLKPLQRVALGIGSARTLLVRLYWSDENSSPEFCIHLHPEAPGSQHAGLGIRLTSPRNGGHYSWRMTSSVSAPDIEFCGGRTSRAVYQLGRDLWRHLLPGSHSLEEIHKLLAGKLETLALRCIVCGASLGTQLLRSTTCQRACSLLLRKSSLEVRLSDLRHDPAVIDLLLATVHAVASTSAASLSGNLLTGFPLTTSATIPAVNNFPALSTLQASPDITSAVRSLGRNAELLLSWMCTSHRGFIASATGVLRIPSMPGVYQFVLASASPEKEKAFAAHIKAPSSSAVVFHGTSLDRLYAIIRDGLRVMSSGRLQKHGAALGRGIYVADEPVTSWSYATPPAPGSGWGSSSLKNTRILLGCEYASPGVQASHGVHVVTDDTKLMVRYIFMCPPTTALPIAAHVAPAMMIGYNSLRNGSV